MVKRRQIVNARLQKQGIMQAIVTIRSGEKANILKQMHSKLQQ
jgi:hypothetical protein